MYHAHNDDSLINQKINTTINCFIDSQIPPTLQIDIPQEVADKILEHKYEKSPYLFREAQVSRGPVKEEFEDNSDLFSQFLHKNIVAK